MTRVNPGAQWYAEGHSLFLLQLGSPPAKVHRVDVATATRSLWKEVAPADPTVVEAIHGIDITPNGRSYAYSFAHTLSDLYLVEGLK